MACLNTLKLEIKTLEQVFPKNHERFQIMSASVDELTCRFVGKSGKKYEIHANITVSRTFLWIHMVEVMCCSISAMGVLIIAVEQRVGVYEGRAVNNGFTEVISSLPFLAEHLAYFSVAYLLNIGLFMRSALQQRR